MSLQEILLHWYQKNKRDLPWRKTADPYKIWVSEIILQQTRVNQGLEYYNRFILRFPSVKKLAEATNDDVMFIWKGLGYYSRARNMHAAAKHICTERNGTFPQTYNELLTLKGIGSYTAAAISSIAFNEDKAVVDGNVIRVYARLFNMDKAYNTADGKKMFDHVANDLLLKNHAGDYNQAVMEFGATHCVPVSPDCASCALNAHCQAKKLNKVSQLPVKLRKTPSKNRYFYFLLMQWKNHIYIEKRSQKDIWHSLFQLPLIETEKAFPPEKIIADKLSGITENAEIAKISPVIKHILSHQNIYATFIHLNLLLPLHTNEYMEVHENTVHTFAFPRLIEKYLEEEHFPY